MTPAVEQADRHAAPASFDAIARRIGRRLRDLYPHPETEALPAEQVQMLLRLRQRERDLRGRDSRYT